MKKKEKKKKKKGSGSGSGRAARYDLTTYLDLEILMAASCFRETRPWHHPMGTRPEHKLGLNLHIVPFCFMRLDARAIIRVTEISGW